MHIPTRLHGEGFSWVVIHGKSHFEGPDSHVLEIPTDFVEKLLIPIRIGF